MMVVSLGSDPIVGPPAWVGRNVFLFLEELEFDIPAPNMSSMRHGSLVRGGGSRRSPGLVGKLVRGGGECLASVVLEPHSAM